jgi:predicted regulator of Ras-like GTPase activity (Roadblock/LC7/MglB family)
MRKGKETKMAESKIDQLDKIMSQALRSTPGLEATAMVSIDGLIIASVLPADIEEDRIAAMTAAILGLSERTAKDMQRGELEQIYIKGNNGYVMIMAVGSQAVLTAIVGEEAKLGLLFVSLKDMAEKIKAILGE